MSPYDKELIKKRFAKHLEQYNRQSTVQMGICDRMSVLINQYVDSEFMAQCHGYELGAGTGFLTKILLNRFPAMNWTINDLVEQTRSYLNNIIISSEAVDVHLSFFDAELAELEQQFALVASSSVVQWFDSLERFIEKIARNIIKGGYFVFSTFGEDNFAQISSLTKDSPITYHSKETIEQWAINSGFEVVYVQSYCVDMLFHSPQDAVRFIKETGINANSKRKWTKTEFEVFCEDYKEKYATANGTPLTFNPMIFILRKK